jgi:hypothetical protein
MSKPEPPKMYTLDELADAARVTRRSVYRWIVEGKLPSAVKVSQKWLVPEAVVLSLLAGRGDVAEPAAPVVKSVKSSASGSRPPAKKTRKK